MRTKTMLGFAATALLLARTVTAAETYKIDPAHSSLAFSVRHLGINNVKGHFDEFAGRIVTDPGGIKEAHCTIQVQSINTGVKMRDDHLRSADFFDAGKHPVITFKTKSVEKQGDQFVLVADFTIRGVPKEVRMPVTLSGPIKDQEGQARIGLEGKLVIHRKEFGINFNAALETGAALVGEEVSIEVNIEAIRQQNEK